jgi:hypothetical protein
MAHRGTIRTVDGYTLYHLADGSVVDSLDPATVDLSWTSFAEFVGSCSRPTYTYTTTTASILADLVSIQTLYRRFQRETRPSMRGAVHDQFEAELDSLVDDLRVECVAALRKEID